MYTESINYQTFAETKRYRSGTDVSRNYEHHVLGSYNRERKPIERDNEIDRPREAYSDDDRHTTRAESTVERHYQEKDVDRDTEERIQREKEQLRNSSIDRKRPIDDHNRSMDYNDKHQGLHPERSLDEDDQWSHQNRHLDDAETSETVDRNRRDVEFYNRKEFLSRERR